MRPTTLERTEMLQRDRNEVSEISTGNGIIHNTVEDIRGLVLHITYVLIIKCSATLIMSIWLYARCTDHVVTRSMSSTIS